MKIKGIFYRKGINGCGVWKIRPPFHKRFNKVCCIHDLMYDWGGGAKERLRADKHLYEGMLSLSTNTRLVLWSSLYYIMVRTFGFLFFNYKD